MSRGERGVGRGRESKIWYVLEAWKQITHKIIDISIFCAPDAFATAPAARLPDWLPVWLPDERLWPFLLLRHTHGVYVISCLSVML